jgi:hypothetical protein
MDTSDPVPSALSVQSELSRWQGRLLPFMVTAIAALAVFFFISSYVQLERLNQAVAPPSTPALEQALSRIDTSAAALPIGEATALLRWKTMALLERDVVRHRYAQVNATMLLRAWTRQLGFVTGMILAFVGAIFILARLSDSGTQLNAEGNGLKGALSTSSPGIVLCVLGTGLMLVTLTINFEATTHDVPVYLGPLAQSSASVAPPAPLDSLASAPRTQVDPVKEAELAQEEQRLMPGPAAPVEPSTATP